MITSDTHSDMYVVNLISKAEKGSSSIPSKFAHKEKRGLICSRIFVKLFGHYTQRQFSAGILTPVYCSVYVAEKKSAVAIDCEPVTI